MSAPVENLVALLNAKRSGKGWLAKCPAHEDRTPSLNITEGDGGRALILCHAGCRTQDVLAALDLTFRDLYPRQSGNGAAPSPRPTQLQHTAAPAFDWRPCVQMFADKHVEGLAKWRGYSIEFCRWLREKQLVGLYDGHIAFPIRDGAKILACHYRQKANENKWLV